ncbi:hypothetical protein ACS0TY_019205 [Phlomoides rotata]
MKHLDIVEQTMNYSFEANSDTLVWPRSVHGTLIARVAYASLQQRFPLVSWGKWIWGPFIPAKRSTTIWRLIHGRLPSWVFSFLEAFLSPRGVSCVTHWWRIWITYLAPALGHVLLSRSPQVTALWRLCIVTIVWAFIRKGGMGITAAMHNSTDDLAILSTFGVQGRPHRAPNIRCVRWQVPLVNVIKINIDGGAAGSPGPLTGGGFSVIVLECFAMSHGRGFAFEAELASTLFAIELAYDKGWKTIWL